MTRRTFYLTMLALLCAAFLLTAAPRHTVQAQGGTPAQHVVQPGENLYRISLKYGVTVQAIAQANSIANPNLIFVGQSLNIPGGTGTGSTGGQPSGGTPTTPTTPSTGTTTYTVVAGDTLSKIARTFNTTAQSIAQANNIANVNLIFVGQTLTISGSSTGTPPPSGGTGNNTTPPPSSGAGGGFELGGHVNGFGNVAEMKQASMSWAKVQIRYKRGANADVSAPAINDAHLNGLKILLGVVGDKNEMAGMDFETYTNEFAQFLSGVAQLGPEAIEVWNEQNIDREWPNGKIDPAAYTTMLRKAYTAIKSVNPNIIVISGAPSPTGAEGAFGTAAVWNDDRYIRGMASAGAANYMDCIGAHYNEGILSPTQSSGDPRGNGGYYTRYFSGMLNTYSGAFGGGKPVCWTELGYLSPQGFQGGAAPAGFEWGNNVTVAQQAQWLGEAATLSRQSGKVRLLIVWNVNFTDAAPDPTGMFAIIRPDKTCPACTNLANAMK